MADTNLPVTPGSGTNVDGYSLDNGNFRQSVVIGSGTTAAVIAPVDAVKGMTVFAYQIPADQCQSVVGASGAAVTATLPAVASQFHYISEIRIERYATVVNTASATPITVTTTNLPGSLAWLVDNGADTLGSLTDKVITPAVPIKSSVAGTATTIVAPASTGVLWRINVHYYVAS
jgi:hypothetical protein